MRNLWRVRGEPDLLWRGWDGEFVAYCAATGSTHHLAGLAAEVFEHLLARPGDCTTLSALITTGFDGAEGEKLRQALPEVIANLAKAEIIEPVER